MKIVIDIPKGVYELLKTDDTDLSKVTVGNILSAVADGIPLEAQPTDAVSREAVEEITFQEPSYTDPYNILTEVREKVRALPPVQPQRKRGKWIVHPKGIYAHLVCSKCLSNAPYDCETNYCPNCGAEMEDKE